ncbi:DOMON domain-containing protein [Klebsormidium nitens]|uniref:DOMON domain-containing protein n=1 Tax=Klebsormidium nitens TaxID=105231 RepID=A0A1Y1HV55_KLENI|nr:DOMON domain-containing protein [Klebsormidium nitens]|eukprot:GAQ81692.1 DOMON domain-containing protein [Klebsormidium nitens]
MRQHQLRGTVEVIDDCTFQVSNLDMLAGEDVYWWGADGESMNQLMGGRRMSADSLVGNYSSQDMVVKLLPGLTWDNATVLGVWSEKMAGDYGHVVLQPEGGWPSSLSPSSPVETGNVTWTFNESALNGSFPPRNASNLTNGSWPLNATEANRTAFSNLTSGGMGLNGTMGASGNLTANGTLDSNQSSGSNITLPESSPSPSETLPLGPLRGAPQPTSFDSCIELGPKLRLRWTVDRENNSIDIGLEGALGDQEFMALGWAVPGALKNYMGHADVVVAGFDASRRPYAEDYFVTALAVCNVNTGSPQGVCPDADFAGPNRTVSNVELVYAQQMDGVTLVRYRRPLISPDREFDNDIDPDQEQPLIWATAASKHPSPFTSTKFPMPLFHGTEYQRNYGEAFLAVGKHFDLCMGPLDASRFGVRENRVGTVVAKKGVPLLVGVGNATSYVNPPNPGKSLYVSGQESPVLQVERGVTTNFTVAAGPAYPVYITDDPVGGAGLLNTSAGHVYAGGPQAYGTVAVPYRLSWTPNHTTPDTVYYQAWSERKMGWQISVVDGGFTDMYPNMATLADGKVNLYWALHYDSISFAVRGLRPSNWLAIAFGSGMVNSNSYVGWLDGDIPRVSTYWMDAHDPSGLHPVKEMLTNQRVSVSGGYISFEFTRLLRIPGSRNEIDPESLLRVVWAYGDAWTTGTLTSKHMHTAMSSDVTLINLRLGVAQVEHLQPVFVVHGFIMFLAWGVLLPGGAIAARYMKDWTGDIWFKVHVYSQTTGLVMAGLGLLFAMGELKGLNLYTTHAKIGMVVLVFGVLQPINAALRPEKPIPGEKPSMPREIWQTLHHWLGRGAMLLSLVAMLSGLVQLNQREDMRSDSVAGLMGGLLVWVTALFAFVVYKEYKSSEARPPVQGAVRIDSQEPEHWTNGESNSVLDPDADEGHARGLSPPRHHSRREEKTSEIQLETL